MKVPSALLLALAIGLQDQTPLPKEPIKDWKYQLKDLRHDPKTNLNIEEVTLILEGKEAIPRSLVKDKEVFDLKGIDARYFTTPGKGDPKSREILIKADRGSIDKGAHTLKLDDKVRVLRKGDPDKHEVDTLLRTPSALLHFTPMFQCAKCRLIFGSAGRCPNDGETLRPTTVTSVETDREFLLTGPEGVMAGTGLATDDAIRREYQIKTLGFVEFSGDVQLGASKKSSDAAQTRFTQVYSKGPLKIAGPENARIVTGEGGVRVDHIDLTETLTLESDTLRLDTVRRWDLSPSGPVDIDTVDARGNVRLDGVSFTDGESFQSTSDTLLRKRTLSPESDVTILTAQAPRVASLKRGPSRIDSRKVTINKAPEGGSGDSEFEDVVRSDLVAGTQHFSLACGKLKTFAKPNAAGKTELQSLDAYDHVVLGGLMARPEAGSPDGAAEPGEARADRFHWDVAPNRGWLSASPLVHITQGPSAISAPLVLLESPEIIVLKGPKQVRLVQEREGKKEEYRGTCDGDLVLDSSAGQNRLWMKNNCVLRTPDMVLNSDRLQAQLTPGGKGLETLQAQGKVHALRTQDKTTLYGDRLFYRFADQTLRVYGNPQAVADAGHTVATQGEIRIYERLDPKTGKKIRYTESIGDGDGVHFVIEEKGK